MATETKDIPQIAFDNLLKRSPWLTAQPDSEGDIPVTDSEHCLIVRVRNYGPEQLKLAALLAAVPELIEALKLAVSRFDYNPGHSDLDNEQPIHLPITLGDYRRINMLIHRAEGK